MRNPKRRCITASPKSVNATLEFSALIFRSVTFDGSADRCTRSQPNARVYCGVTNLLFACAFTPFGESPVMHLLLGFSFAGSRTHRNSVRKFHCSCTSLDYRASCRKQWELHSFSRCLTADCRTFYLVDRHVHGRYFRLLLTVPFRARLRIVALRIPAGVATVPHHYFSGIVLAHIERYVPARIQKPWFCS